MNGKHDKIPDLDVQTLAGEYVMGTLNARQRAEVQERLTNDPALRKAVEGWRSRLLTLTQMALPRSPPLPPPTQPDSQDKPPPAPVNVQSWRTRRVVDEWNSVKLWRGLAWLGLIVSLMLTTQLMGRMPTPAAPNYLAVLARPGDNLPGWVVQASDLRGIELVPVDKIDIPPGKVLQLWTQSDDWQGPISLGLVAPGQVLKFPADRLPPLRPQQRFELSLEKAGGSSGKKPSGPIQFVGRIVKAL